MMLSKVDEKYFLRARDVALLSDYHKTHVGCVAVYHGQVIAIGYNSNKTHPSQKYYNRFRYIEGIVTKPLLPKLHAEIDCINQLRHQEVNFSKVKLYIYRIRSDQPYGNARPCLSCMAAIRDTGIRDIYYTTDDGFVYERIKRGRRVVDN